MSGVLVAFIRVERRGSHGYRAAITSLNDIQDRVVESGIKLIHSESVSNMLYIRRLNISE